MTQDETIEAVKRRVEERLSGMVENVITSVRDGWHPDAILGVGIVATKGPPIRRHAIGGLIRKAMDNPVLFADAAADRLLEWLAKERERVA